VEAVVEEIMAQIMVLVLLNMVVVVAAVAQLLTIL
jgi:hypothetical protein